MRMRPWKYSPLFIVTIATLLFANGCKLDRRAITALGKVEPAQFCPGDTLRASYDLTVGEPCPSDVDCSVHFPNVAISSAPESFPSTSFHAYAGGLDFVPAADSVAVTFDIDRDSVLIPTARFEDGHRVFIQRTPIIDNTVTVTRTDPFSRELVHDGMCAGASPVNAPAMLPGPPQFSSNLRLQSLCNTNGVAILITLSGGGGTYSQTLMPGECFDATATAPDIPSGLDASTTVQVARLVPDLGARCSATGPNTPPSPLRTLARMGCR
ncbi:hypothetical protein GCM10027430_03790 [Lysobacter tyrosinilyticus]